MMIMREAIKNAVGAVETWISDDIGTAMNRYNINPNPKPKKEKTPQTSNVSETAGASEAADGPAE